MPARQDINKEREALDRLVKRGVYVQDRQKELDAAEAFKREGKGFTQQDIYKRVYGRDKPQFAEQKHIYQEAYGSRYPTFEKEFGLGEKRKALDERESAADYRKSLGERAEQFRTNEDARIAEAFQAIKDPGLRERLMRQNRSLRDSARRNNLGQALELYQLDTQNLQSGYNRALQEAYAADKERYGRSQEEIGLERAEEQRQREMADALEFEKQKLALQAMYAPPSAGGRRGGGGGRRGGGGRSGGGGDDLLDDLQSQIDQGYRVLEGYSATGGQTREEFADSLSRAYGVDPDLVQQAIYQRYPDLTEKQRNINIGLRDKKLDSDEFDSLY